MEPTPPVGLTLRGQAHLMATLYVENDMPVRELARVCKISPDTVYSRLRLVGINVTDREPWYHPHYVGWDQEYGYWFKPFTGDEPAPYLPYEFTRAAEGWDKPIDLAEDTDDETERRIAQWDAARLRWNRARYLNQMGRPLTEARAQWPTLVAARDAMATAFTQLVNAPDGYWTSSVSRCVAAHQHAREAAAAWDRIWAEAARIGETCDLAGMLVAGIAPTFTNITIHNKLDVSSYDWTHWTHTSGTESASAAVEADIQTQRRHIADVNSLISTGGQS